MFCFGLLVCSIILTQPTLTQTIPKRNIPTSPLTIPTTPVQDIGDNRSFWALDFDTMEPYIVDAHLLAIGDHCYIYFDDLAISIIGENEASARAETYRDEFDNNIYSRVTDLAGDPDGTLGDVDGDPKVYILVVEHYQSYYRQSNEVEGEYSNMCEMVYICYRTSDPVGTISHEFHHLVWFNYEFDEVHFVLEGAAEYATYYSSYLPVNNWTSRVHYFLEDINDSLIYFEVEAQDYGACYLFAFYLAEQYGEQFLRDLVPQEEDGAQGLETALEAAGYNITFNDLYLDWMTALTIDEQGLSDDRYCLQDMNATIQDYTAIGSLPYQDNSLALYCYGSKVYQLSTPPDSFRVELSQPADDVAGLSVAYRDTYGWHVKQAQEEGTAVVHVTGVSIEEVHVVASYLYPEPPASDIDFGSGPREIVQILIQEWNETSDTPIPSPTATPSTVTNTFALLVVAGAMPLSAALIVLFLILQKKEQEKLSVSS
jgi:hypothetical protein